MIQLKFGILFLALLKLNLLFAQSNEESLQQKQKIDNQKGLVKTFKNLDEKDLEKLLKGIKNNQAALLEQMKKTGQIEQMGNLENIGKGNGGGNLENLSLENLAKGLFSSEENKDKDGNIITVDYPTQVHGMLAFFRTQSPKDVEVLIKQTFSQGAVGKFVQNSPKIVTFLTKLLRDEIALPKAAQIYQNKNKIRFKIFLGLIIVTFILSFILKRHMGFLKRFAVIWSVRLSAFGLLFGKFFLPICKIGINSFF